MIKKFTLSPIRARTVVLISRLKRRLKPRPQTAQTLESSGEMLVRERSLPKFGEKSIVSMNGMVSEERKVIRRSNSQRNFHQMNLSLLSFSENLPSIVR
jgi:hypothetical protein